MHQLVDIAAELRDGVEELSFSPPVTHVYDPLDYAWEGHRAYLERFGAGTGRIVLLGMNPGPFGMAQTGVPFGDVDFVRDWMGIEAEIGRPADEHPKRPVEGFDCPRNEVSGSRLWSWARDRFGPAESFFQRFFVVNYCPLAFLEESGRNRTPNRLSAEERAPLFAVCDRALRRTVEALEPERAIGIGRFAEGRLAETVGGDGLPIGCILHPSPASPAANRDWTGTVERQLTEMGVPVGG